MNSLLIVVLVSGFALCLAQECSEAPGVTGCSIPRWVPYRNKFTPACYKHDVCYACGSSLGVNRLTCDRNFRTNMRDTCSNWWCKRSADIYYRTVRWFGGPSFTNKSPEWCNEDWVSKCMT